MESYESKPGWYQGWSNCDECPGKMVYPLSWTEVEPGQWLVPRRCPDCENFDEILMEEDQMQEYDSEVEDGLYLVRKSLEKLTKKNMSENLRILVNGLEADAILPEDFRSL